MSQVMQEIPPVRPLAEVIDGQATSDGAGVSLVRLVGTSRLVDLDPFLLLDAFRSDDPQDYIAGFPPHPHRGFETVTYLLNGRMRHADSAGNAGVIEAGGVQWMSAGRGIIHSEMPEQEEGLLSGFQLWVNLPAAHKMDPPRYQELVAAEIPLERTAEGGEIRVIAGRTDAGTEGPVGELVTPVCYLDIRLPAGATFVQHLPAEWNVLLHPVSGSVVPTPGAAALQADQLGVLGSGQRVELRAGAEGVRLLLIGGRPLGEPIARHGPFVMNSEAELRQAFDDYQNGRLAPPLQG